MWTNRSHLLRYIKDKYQVDFSQTGSYKDLLSRKAKEEKPTQSAIFTKEELFRYIVEAPNEGASLRHKLVAITAYYGACRIADIVFLEFKDIKIEPNQILVTIQRCCCCCCINDISHPKHRNCQRRATFPNLHLEAAPCIRTLLAPLPEQQMVVFLCRPQCACQHLP